jgi:Flp pilus assembly protein TadG
MMGLAIDASLMYGVKSKIQMATDGASLAAARALSIGLTTAAQATSARNNATNWFNRNFPSGEFGSSGTTVAQPQVFDDAVNPLIRHVVVSATTTAPSFFMRFWGYTGTVVNASSEATRRDSVIMMVLDRSGSMANSNSCTPMKDAAKLFTGMFAPQRDRIGMITFNMASNISQSPTTNFQTVLGYTNSSQSPPSGTGLIDGITCVGGTGTAEATILGYNELYKVGLPGALNVLMLFTDGLPTALTFDFRGGVTTNTGILESTSTCQDSLNRSVASTASPRGHMVNNPRAWTTGWDFGTGSFLANVPTGPIAVVYGDDQPLNLWGLAYRVTTDAQGDTYLGTSAPGCNVASSASNQAQQVAANIDWYPSTDAFGNALEGYNSLTFVSGRIDQTNANLQNAALNASANAASRARTDRNLPDGRNFPGVVVYCIGLGTVNHAFLQRVANDGAADDSGSNLYPAFAGVDTTQPTGNYVYANNSAALAPAFSQIASFILRLSQ